jgi:hypothetical protein
MDPQTKERMRLLAEGKDPSRWTGLGDVVASATRKLGFKKPCAPCQQRKEWLNKKVPFRR